VAVVVVAVLTCGVSGAAALYVKLNTNIDTVDVASLLGPAPSSTQTTTPDPDDPNAGRAMNILVLGSDHRDEAAMESEGKGAPGGMRADTTIVVHVSADRSRVELVSIPSCLMSDGSETKARSEDMINTAFATGWDNGGDLASAAACSGRTVQENTGLTIDHFVVVDFGGFQSMVNAIGGVNICIPEDLSDPKYTGLDLKAGQQVLSGEDAFKFARARHGNIGDGSDIARIGNQQRLIQAIITQVLSADVLTDVPTLVSFLSAATSSLTLDSGLDLNALTGLAWSARSIRTDNITFMTIPWGAAGADGNRVKWTSAADAVWAAMAADTPIVTDETADAATPDAGTGTDPATGTDPGTGSTAAPTTPTTELPTQVETRKAGREAFTGADVTATCG
jgi:LCP family protein required for cell wall assembly